MSSKRNSSRGFSLIETMIAAALLGIIGAAVATVLGFAARESGQSRLRTIASANAREALERVAHTVRLAEHHRLADGDLCALLESAGGPMDTAGATVVGACPARNISNIPITGTLLRRRVQVVVLPAVGAPSPMPRRYEVLVEISGTGLSKPITAKTQVLRDSK